MTTHAPSVPPHAIVPAAPSGFLDHSVKAVSKGCETLVNVLLPKKPGFDRLTILTCDLLEMTPENFRRLTPDRQLRLQKIAATLTAAVASATITGGAAGYANSSGIATIVAVPGLALTYGWCMKQLEGWFGKALTDPNATKGALVSRLGVSALAAALGVTISMSGLRIDQVNDSLVKEALAHVESDPEFQALRASMNNESVSLAILESVDTRNMSFMEQSAHQGRLEAARAGFSKAQEDVDDFKKTLRERTIRGAGVIDRTGAFLSDVIYNNAGTTFVALLAYLLLESMGPVTAFRRRNDRKPYDALIDLDELVADMELIRQRQVQKLERDLHDIKVEQDAIEVEIVRLQKDEAKEGNDYEIATLERKKEDNKLRLERTDICRDIVVKINKIMREIVDGTTLDDGFKVSALEILTSFAAQEQATEISDFLSKLDALSAAHPSAGAKALIDNLKMNMLEWQKDWIAVQDAETKARQAVEKDRIAKEEATNQALNTDREKERLALEQAGILQASVETTESRKRDAEITRLTRDAEAERKKAEIQTIKSGNLGKQREYAEECRKKWLTIFQAGSAAGVVNADFVVRQMAEQLYGQEKGQAPLQGSTLDEIYRSLNEASQARVNDMYVKFSTQQLPFDAGKLEVRGVDVFYDGVNIGYPPMDIARGDPQPPILESVPAVV